MEADHTTTERKVSIASDSLGSAPAAQREGNLIAGVRQVLVNVCKDSTTSCVVDEAEKSVIKVHVRTGVGASLAAG